MSVLGEEKRREEEGCLYNIYNSSSQEEDYKIIRSINVSHVLWESGKRFASLTERSLSNLIECALTEYMRGHVGDLPVSASFNMVLTERRLCEFANCRNPMLQSVLWLPKNREMNACADHVRYARLRPDEYRVTPE